MSLGKEMEWLIVSNCSGDCWDREDHKGHPYCEMNRIHCNYYAHVVKKQLAVWHKSITPKVPCPPYEMKEGGMVSYYYPYHLTLYVRRRITKNEREAQDD